MPSGVFSFFRKRHTLGIGTRMAGVAVPRDVCKGTPDGMDEFKWT